LANRWVNEYQAVEKDYKVDVISSGEGVVTELHKDARGIGLVGSGKNVMSLPNSFTRITVGRDVIIPVANNANPLMGDFLQSGMTQEEFRDLFLQPGNSAFHIFIEDSRSVRSALMDYLDLKWPDFPDVVLLNSTDFVKELQHDHLAIGFCKLASIVGPGDQSFPDFIRLVPIDRNGNGRIDYMEDIYHDPGAFSRGVWIGKYPNELRSDIVCVFSPIEEDNSSASFIKWIMTKGQHFLYQYGMVDLVSSERKAGIELLNPQTINIPPPGNSYSLATLIIFMGLLVAFILAVIGILIFSKKQKAIAGNAEIDPGRISFSYNSLAVPRGLYYDKTHTWAFLEKDGLVIMGLDDFLTRITGTIDKIVMKDPGSRIKKGDVLCSIFQKGKQLNIYSPVSGTIRKTNTMISNYGFVLNTAPYSDGWIYAIEPANWTRDIQFMQMADKYKLWLYSEFSRIRDFLLTSLKVNKVEFDQVILQDGGTIKESVLEDLGPEVWEDFQANILDVVR
jgi:glycine cleavage system H lipoate-binding protein